MSQCVTLTRREAYHNQTSHRIVNTVVRVGYVVELSQSEVA